LLYNTRSNSVPKSTAVKTNLTASGGKTQKVNIIVHKNIPFYLGVSCGVSEVAILKTEG
jgi:4-diphosphocytidyl-2C-methyl-D-erythritol kinase